MGRKQEEDEEALGNHGYGDRNARGQLLVDLCEDFKLRSVNSFFKGRPGRKWTWISPDRRTRNCIDYVLAPRSIKFRSSTVLGSANAGSDHRILRAIIQPPTPATRRTEPPPKERKRLNRNLFRMATALQPPVIDRNSPLAYTQLVDYIREASQFAEEPAEKTRRLKSSTIALLRQRHLLRQRQATASNRLEFTEFNKMVRREIRKDINDHHRLLVEEAVKNARGLRTLHKETTIGRRHIVQLRNQEGALCTTKTMIHDAVREFYNELYASTVHVDYEASEAMDDCPEFLEIEVREALQKMKTGRSPGQDKVTVEMLKLGENTFIRPLTDIFNRCLRCCEVPEKMADASTVLLYKKGDPLLIKNYKPISLLSVIYKLLTKTIVQRIEHVLDAAQPVEQAGFRRNFSTIDHLHAVNELLEKTREYRVPIYIVFVDFEKAFDTVEANAIWKAIERQGVPRQIIALLRRIQDEAASHIQLGEDRVPINIQRGVRQGDVISPKLFTATLEQIFRELDWTNCGLIVNGERLSNLRFADDIALVATSEEELQKMVDELNEVSLRSGLKINAEKTKIMANEEATILLNGNALEQVEAFVYLGQEVRLARNHLKEVGRRIRSGWNVFRKYQEFLTSPSVLMRWKRRLFNQCVLPAMLYGCETWTLTKAARRKLETSQRRMERRMLRVRLLDRRTNEWLRGVTKLKDAHGSATRRKWNYAWKTARELPEKWSTKLEEWRPPTTRPIGRPRTRWRDDFTKKLGMQRWRQRAREEDRQQWIHMGCGSM
ncbi:hypothetical protein QR680_013439 [Steinernema hermaphroditum]|uniref:Reverse transcriptase domain-containing protein n=1 Tax=Steinernema hermaphroditum TaxID=289476 RepID=A0AA39M2I5_9BILA|nr:hypothetical protein QR680_013439 [Steinernema hermaphroditum]